MRLIYLFAIILCILTNANFLYAQTWKSVKAEKHFQQGLKEMKASQPAKAIQSLEESVKLNPKHIDAQVQLAKLYFTTRKYKQAIKTAHFVIKESPRYEDIYYYMIGAYLSLNNAKEALRFNNLALKYFPLNRDFAIKKLNILDVLKRFQDGDSWSQIVLKRYPTDPAVRRSSAGHYEAKADWYVEKQLEELAKTNYEKALELAPNNSDLVEKLNNLVAQGGDINAKIAKANASLNRNSNSYQALYYKLGLLEEAGRYAEALDVLRTILRYYPKDKKALLLSSSLRKDAAGHYQNTDVYTLYQSILDQNPNDQEALQKVTGMAVAKGDIKEALYRVDRALTGNALNTDLLRQKMDLEFQLHRYKTAADIANKLYLGSKEAGFRSELIQVINACGNYYLQQQLADSALIYYRHALTLDSANLLAIQGQVNGLILKNNWTLALSELDKAIKIHPGNLDLQIRKAGFLAESGEILEAVKLSGQLYRQHPKNSNIRSLYLEQELAAANAYMLAELYTEAENHLRLLLKEEPENKDALNYLANILDLQGLYNEALETTEAALKSYPEDRDLLQKKAAILYNDHRYLASANLASTLFRAYPFNAKYKQLAGDAWFAASLDYRKKGLTDSALVSVDSVIAIKPADSTALLLKTNILIDRRQFDDGLATVNEALQTFEYAEAFLLRKVLILDSLKRYTEAANFADTVARRYVTKKNIDYAALLRSKTLYNSFGLTLLNSSFSQINELNPPSPYNLATIDYMRSDTGKISYGGTLSFVGRQQGVGAMIEGNVSYKVSNRWYWNASIAASNNVILPRYRIGYSLFPTFKSGLEAEFGLRYFEVGGFQVLSAVTGLGKQFGPFDVNARLFGFYQNSEPYFSFTTIGRYELSEVDLLQANLGIGSSPDDLNRLILFPQSQGISTVSVGAAYRRTFQYRTAIGISGSYTNQKINNGLFYNQYDLQLSLRVKF